MRFGLHACSGWSRLFPGSPLGLGGTRGESQRRFGTRLVSRLVHVHVCGAVMCPCSMPCR